MTEGERERTRRFDALFASHSSDIVAYCGWRARSAADAQDAVADVFLTAWRRLDELPEGDAALLRCQRHGSSAASMLSLRSAASTFERSFSPDGKTWHTLATPVCCTER